VSKTSLPREVFQRLAQAYLMMAKYARYRPQAPGDGCGHITLSDSAIADPQQLLKEAEAYAVAFREEEDADRFYIGCSDFRTNRSLIYVIEAARALCSANVGLALDLLALATEDVERSIAEDRYMDDQLRRGAQMKPCPASTKLEQQHLGA
jgi:hypothetical protein